MLFRADLGDLQLICKYWEGIYLFFIAYIFSANMHRLLFWKIKKMKKVRNNFTKMWKTQAINQTKNGYIKTTDF